MAETDFLTTRTTEWNRGILHPPLWTDRGDLFHVDFKEDEKLPLVLLDTIGGPGSHVEKRQSTTDQRLVAVKKLHTYQNEATNTQLKSEVEILRSLNHYHCVNILGTFTQDDFFRIVMEPCAMCDLNTYLSEPTSVTVKKMEGRYGPRESFLPSIMGCLAHGLQYLHKEPRARHNSDEERMVRHKDITPRNIVLDGPRVLYTDFGLSKFVTTTQTGSSGPSRKTSMYTSPERSAETHRNKSCDIFSLACVFAEIFNVYKGKTVKDFLQHRKNADPEGEGYFHHVIPEVLSWLDDLATERCDVQVIRLLRTMFSIQPSHRPNAEHVWKDLTTITKTSPFSNIYFCGPCCMPLQHEDPLLKTGLGVDPSHTKYGSSLPLLKATPVSRDLNFKDKYDRDQRLDVCWKRNLRHWNLSILDVVQDGKDTNLLARKRIKSSGDPEGSFIANNEAEILRKVKHKHIVTLHGTYRHGDLLTLLYKPAADHDLRSYLELCELQMKRKLPVDCDFLRRSFGCLANALTCVHTAGYDHGDIRPENILVHDRRIYLSKFSFGLKSDMGTKDSRPSNQQPYRFKDLFGKLSLRSLGDSQATAAPGLQQCQQSDQYRSPEWKPTAIGQPTSDIFALGCVFIELYTVYCGQRVRDFETFRVDDKGEVAYHRTIPKSLEWLSTLSNEEHEDRDMFRGVIRDMIETDASKRLTADDVARVMRQCKTSTGLLFTGECSDHI